MERSEKKGGRTGEEEKGERGYKTSRERAGGRRFLARAVPQRSPSRLVSATMEMLGIVGVRMGEKRGYARERERRGVVVMVVVVERNTDQE